MRCVFVCVCVCVCLYVCVCVCVCVQRVVLSLFSPPSPIVSLRQFP
jgi:hypothetical protein